MHLHHTSLKNTATCGALVNGASWIDSGITPGLVVVDSSRPAVFAHKPAFTAGIAVGLLLQAIAPI